VNDRNLDRLIENSMFCSEITAECRNRTCKICVLQEILISEFDGAEDCCYENWNSKNVLRIDRKQHRRTSKEKIVVKKIDLVCKFQDEFLLPYIRHKAVEKHQREALKSLKNTLTDEELIIHINFAENYACKYASETQIIHFGGNREHVLLHTGVFYCGKIVQSFCTISPDLSHTPISIFKHLEALRHYDRSKIKSLYFQSDSPATQYRSRKMFYIMIKKIIPLFCNLQHFVWLYSEPGHGKGPVDGVGATMKRTCDRHVGNGHDVSTFEQFQECVSTIEGIDVIPVLSVSDKELEKEVNERAVTVKGER
jgi:hypothetical protein